jgi:uncharacterized protein (TIGR02246 family)
MAHAQATGTARPPAPGAAAPRAAAAAPAATAPAAAAPAAEDPREKPVRDLIRVFAQAYNAADAKALADLFVDSASVVDPSGGETQGKAAISEMYAGSFRETPGLKLESETDQVRLLTPDLARVEGRSRVFASSGAANEFTRFTALAVQSQGKWRLAEIREQTAALEEIAPYERLQELEFMVGDWVDESDGNKVVVNVRWADKQSYLIRTYSVELQGEKAHSGTMFIGWDPLTEQIKSWVFDSEGGHGEGLWTRTSDSQWVVKASGVLRDGRPTSATHIHNIVNKDAVKTSSIDRIIGGQIAPDILDIVMVRRPPQPAAAAPRPVAAPRPAAAPAPPPGTVR